MSPIDWRDLYAQNRAVIERSGLSVPQLPSPTPPAGLLPRRTHPIGAPLRFDDRDPLPGLDAPGGERTFTVRGRGRQALVFAPAGVGVDTPVPLVCLLHGCTQDPVGFAAATRIAGAAEQHGFVAVLPAQDRAANPMRCWNWFEPDQQRRDRGEPAAIAGIIAEMIGESEPRIDARRVFVCGLSSGGAMAAILAATYPDLVSAAAIHSGLSYGAASDTGSAFAAMANGGPDPAAQGRAAYAAMGRHARAVPTIVVHGLADRTVAPVNAHQVLRQTMTANRLAAPECEGLDERHPTSVVEGSADGGLRYTRRRWTDRRGVPVHELLLVNGLGHAWSGGFPGASHTDPRGPDATDAILRFFAAASRG